jgi:hypothetical protein
MRNSVSWDYGAETTDFSEENLASIFRVKGKTESETRFQAGGMQNFQSGVFLGLFVYHEDGINMFLRNVC